jgi:hypothetical protein
VSPVVRAVSPAVAPVPVVVPLSVSPGTMPMTAVASAFTLLGSISGKFVCADEFEAIKNTAAAARPAERVCMCFCSVRSVERDRRG